MNYITLRADIQSSKKNLKYNLLEEFLNEVKNDLKLTNNTNSVVDLKVRAGDEVFGVYNDSKTFMNVLYAIYKQGQKLNIPLYLGIGIGEIDKVSSDSEIINGPSIWNATKALKYVKENTKKYNVFINKNLSFNVVTNNLDNSNVIKNLMYTYFNTISKRTNQQTLAVEIYEQHPNLEKDKLYQLLTKRKFSNPTEDETRNMIRLFDKFLTRAEYNFSNDLKNSLVYMIERA